jgi:signal transduction histidine kinase
LPDVALALAFAAVILAAGWYGAQSGPTALRLDLPVLPKSGLSHPVKIIGVGSPAGWDWGGVAGTISLMAVPLAWRRQLPLAVLVTQFVAALTIPNVGWPGLFALFVGAYSLARYRSPLVSLGTLLAAGGLVAATVPNSTPNLPGWLTPFAILLPIGLSGAAIRSARSRADASAERAALLEREREAATQAAVAQERSRIARELHDVVSHHVSVMTIQAGAAGRVLAEHPDLARGAVSAIEASGREAMAELRHLLGLLAEAPAADGLDAPLRPQPGLDQLDALVAAVRAAGQPVTTRIRVPQLPGGVDLAAYRVVQEALTNAIRYAPGACTEVTVERDGADLVIEVIDAGVECPPEPSGAGTGLIGLAERLGLYRGTLEAGRRAGGGFRVRARVPLAEEVTA